MNVIDLVKDMAVIGVGILLILSLFVLHAFTNNLHDTLQEALPTGKAIVISSGGAPSNATSPPPPKRESTPLQDPRLRCLMRGGVTADDIEIGGRLFKGFPCEEEVEEEKIAGEIVNTCLTVHVGERIDTTVCKKDRGIGLTLVIPPGGTGKVLPPVQKRNYTALLLFVLFMVTLFGVWRQFEVREHKREERERERGATFRLPGETVEVNVIKSAPLFAEIVPEEESMLSSDEVQGIHERLMQEQKEALHAAALKEEEIGEYIKSFNAIGKEISGSLKAGKLHKARKKYLFLFPIYTRLYGSVGEGQKAQLVDVIKYLHDQINIMEKSRTIRHLIEEAYKETEEHRVDMEEKKEDVVVLKDDHQHDNGPAFVEAHDLFSALGREKGEKKTSTPLRLHKEDVLEEIDKIHARLQKQRDDENLRSGTTLKALRSELESLKDLVYQKEKKKKAP